MLVRNVDPHNFIIFYRYYASVYKYSSQRHSWLIFPGSFIVFFQREWVWSNSQEVIFLVKTKGRFRNLQWDLFLVEEWCWNTVKRMMVLTINRWRYKHIQILITIFFFFFFDERFHSCGTGRCSMILFICLYIKKLKKTKIQKKNKKTIIFQQKDKLFRRWIHLK